MHACAGLVGAAGEDGDASGVQRGPEQGRDVASASAGVEEGKEDLSTVVIRLREASASTYAGAKRAGAANGDRIGAGQVGEVQWEPKAGQRDVSPLPDLARGLQIGIVAKQLQLAILIVGVAVGHGISASGVVVDRGGVSLAVFIP